MTNIEQNMIEKTAKSIVNKIVNDLCNRSGLQNEWDNIDADIQKEIKKTWMEIVMSEM